MSFRNNFQRYLTRDSSVDSGVRDYKLLSYSSVFSGDRAMWWVLLSHYAVGSIPLWLPFWWKESLWTINFARRGSWWLHKVNSRAASRRRYVGSMSFIAFFASLPAFYLFQLFGRVHIKSFPDDEAGACASAGVMAGAAQGVIVGLVRSIIYLDQFGPNVAFPIRSIFTLHTTVGIASGLVGAALVYFAGFVEIFQRGTALPAWVKLSDEQKAFHPRPLMSSVNPERW